MNGPKHLWSGDWERESTRAAEERPNTPLPALDAEDSEPEVTQAPRRRPWASRRAAVALAAGVAAAAVAVVLVATLGGGSPKHNALNAAAPPRVQTQVPQQTTPQQTTPQSSPKPQTASQPTPVVTGPTAYWLGMQIVTSPEGAVISTVRLGSAADRAGFEPGDEIMRIDGHEVGQVSQLRTDTANLQIGAAVDIQVLRSSVVVVAKSVPMTERPTIHP